jgi:galactose mutarotase-like enzyme
MITKKEAGTVNGKAVAQYTLENENGLAMTFYTYGGIIQSLLVKPRGSAVSGAKAVRRAGGLAVGACGRAADLRQIYHGKGDSARE